MKAIQNPISDSTITAPDSGGTSTEPDPIGTVLTSRLGDTATPPQDYQSANPLHPPLLFTTKTNDNKNAYSIVSGYSSDSDFGGGEVTEEETFKNISSQPFAQQHKRTRSMVKRNEQETEDQSGNSTGEPLKSKQRIYYANAVELADSAKAITAERPSLSYKVVISFNTNTEEKECFEKAYDNQLMKMDTWDTETIYDTHSVPKNRIINSMFIFTTKRNGTNKCRFVARGDQQKPETYLENLQANTVHNYALMTSMAIALDKNTFVTQLDISSAYLYAELKEEPYIRTPLQQLQGKVLRLQKSLYGPKQSGANWYQTIREYLEMEGHVCL